MKIKQIRNATMIVTYADKKFLIDPMLAEKEVYPSFPATPNQNLNNPTVDLPVSIDEILDVDAVIVTHIQLEHFDLAAIELIPKDMKMFAQNEDEAEQMKTVGFNNVEVLKEEGILFDDIELIKTPAQHYSQETIVDLYRQLKSSDEACGVILRNNTKERSLYIMGDAIFNEEIKNVLNKYKPDVVAVNAGNAQLNDGRYLTMSKEDFYEAVEIAPYARYLATHMEALNNLMVSRKELREYAEEKGFSDRLLIPADGETCEF